MISNNILNSLKTTYEHYKPSKIYLFTSTYDTGMLLSKVTIKGNLIKFTMLGKYTLFILLHPLVYLKLNSSASVVM